MQPGLQRRAEDQDRWEQSPSHVCSFPDAESIQATPGQWWEGYQSQVGLGPHLLAAG